MADNSIESGDLLHQAASLRQRFNEIIYAVCTPPHTPLGHNVGTSLIKHVFRLFICLSFLYILSLTSTVLPSATPTISASRSPFLSAGGVPRGFCSRKTVRVQSECGNTSRGTEIGRWQREHRHAQGSIGRLVDQVQTPTQQNGRLVPLTSRASSIFGKKNKIAVLSPRSWYRRIRSVTFCDRQAHREVLNNKYLLIQEVNMLCTLFVRFSWRIPGGVVSHQTSFRVMCMVRMAQSSDLEGFRKTRSYHQCGHPQISGKCCLP